MTIDPERSRVNAPRHLDPTGPHDATVRVGGPRPDGHDSASGLPGREAGSSARQSDTAAPEGTGETLIRGRFQLESALGSGGMGKVYKARDLRKVEARDRDPWVAIKLLNESFRDHPSALIALQREARKSQALTHPNIVKVFDFDRDGDTAYMTMELLRGNDLAHFIKVNPTGVGVTEALRLTRQIGEALQHAHAVGIVHADLTPRNVFLTDDGAAKVLDFGIAQAIAGADLGEASPHATAFNPASLGGLTPAYASLQRLEGEEPVPADDIYALGCLVYELLSGAHPTQYCTAVQAMARNQKPLPIAGLKGRQWVALKKALALPREDRYEDVGRFLDDFLPKKRRGGRYAAVAAAVALSIAGIAAWQTYQVRDEQRASAAALSARQEALALSQERLVRQREAAAQQAAAALERSNGEQLASAAQLIERGQFDAADAFLKRVESSSPDNSRLLELQRALAAARLADQQQRRELASTAAEIEQLLESADMAIAADRLITPRGQGAYAYYQRVIELDADNAIAQRGLRQLVRLQVDRIENAIAAGQLQAASDGLEDLVLLSSQDPNLGRLQVDLQAAQAAREQREGRVRNLLSRAGDADSADERRNLYLEALTIDPNHAGAKAGLAQIQEDLARRQREARDAAQSLVEEARALLALRPFQVVNLQKSRALLLQARGLWRGIAGVDELLGGMPQQYMEAINDRMAASDYAQAEKLTQAALLLTPDDDKLVQLRDDLVARLAASEQPVVPVSF